MAKEFCEECGAALPDGARFCEECGTAVGATKPEQSLVASSPQGPPPPPPRAAPTPPPSPPSPEPGTLPPPPPQPMTPSESAGATGAPAPSGRLWRVLVGIVLLLALGGGGYWLTHRAAVPQPQTTASLPSQSTPPQTIALPDAKAKEQEAAEKASREAAEKAAQQAAEKAAAETRQAREAAEAKRRADRDRRMELVEQGAKRFAAGDLAGGRASLFAALKGGESVFYSQDGPIVDKARSLLQTIDDQLDRQRRSQAALAAFDGNYAGTFTGPTKGSMSFRIDGRKVQGKIWNNDMTGVFRGQFDPQNQSLLCELGGKIFFINFTGSLNGTLKGGKARGNWRATGIGTETGTWSAAKAP